MTEGSPEDAPPGHAGQSSQAGAADHPVEDRLGLIVTRVADRHGRRPSGGGDLMQPGIPGTPCIGLEMPRSHRLPPAQVQRQPERAGEAANKLGVVPRRVAPHAMIQVRHREAQAQLGGQPVQHPEQAHAVAASRDRHDPDRLPFPPPLAHHRFTRRRTCSSQKGDQS